MRDLHEPADVARLPNGDLRALVEQRIDEMSEVEPWEEGDSVFIVVEAGDTVETLEAETGFPILRSLYSDIPFGDPGFSPCFEFAADHGTFYELVYVPGGESGITLLIEKRDGVDPDLLAFCALYATDAP